MRVAVIGGGVSGLVCAYLVRDLHEVVLFEQAEVLGGHAHTVDIDIDIDFGEARYAIDTGFIVCNDRTYPNFMRLLDRLRVSRRKTQMSFSVSCEDSGVEYGSVGLNGLFAQRQQSAAARPLPDARGHPALQPREPRLAAGALRTEPAQLSGGVRLFGTLHPALSAADVRVQADSWLRWLVAPIDLTYDIASGRLLRYAGLSNIRSESGDRYDARIDFPAAAVVDQ